MFLSRIALAAAVGLIASPGLAADPLAAFAGAWNGVGESRPGPGEPFERATCEMTASFVLRTATLRTDGRCRGAGMSFPTADAMTAGVATGTFSSPTGIGVVIFDSTVTFGEGGFVVDTVLDGGDLAEVINVRQVVGWPTPAGWFDIVILVFNPTTEAYVEFSHMRFARAD